MNCGSDAALCPLLGNHEEMMLNYLDGKPQPDDWLQFGGAATVESYREANGKMQSMPVDIISTSFAPWGDYCETVRIFLLTETMNQTGRFGQAALANDAVAIVEISAFRSRISRAKPLSWGTLLKRAAKYSTLATGLHRHLLLGGWLATAMDSSAAKSGKSIVTAAQRGFARLSNRKSLRNPNISLSVSDAGWYYKSSQYAKPRSEPHFDERPFVLPANWLIFSGTVRPKLTHEL